MKKKSSIKLVVLALIVLAVGVNFLGGAGGLLDEYFELDHDAAAKKLDRMLRDVDSREQFVTRRANVKLAGKPDLNQTLPDIDEFPLVVSPRRQSGTVIAELFVSTEKSGDGTDGWLVEVARAFNNANQRVSGGTAKVAVRKIASGTGFQFIASGKHVPQGFSPSNHLWIRMTEAYGVSTASVSERLVGNIAGVVMKSEVADRLRETYGVDAGVEQIIDAVVQGNLVMGYTNPFSSSTGLNYLVSVLARFGDGDEARMLSDDVVSAFESFQRGVPFVALTTLQMRESVENDGSLDAFVMEHQTYVKTPALQSGYEFVPFGIPHDNPLYAVGNPSSAAREVLDAFAEFASQARWTDLATQYGFNPAIDHLAPFEIPSGDLLVRAQQLWKEKKDAGRPIVAVFLCDVSGSMAGQRMAGVQQALTQGADFITPTNSIGMVLFDQKVSVVLPIKPFNLNHKASFLAATQGMNPAGSTAMYDGILVSLSMLLDAQRANPDAKPVLFVLTDGETNVGHSFGDVRRIIKGLGIPIYTIGYEANIDELKRLSAEVEAASLNAGVERIEYMIGSLLNAQM